MVHQAFPACEIAAVSHFVCLCVWHELRQSTFFFKLFPERVYEKMCFLFVIWHHPKIETVIIFDFQFIRLFLVSHLTSPLDWNCYYFDFQFIGLDDPIYATNSRHVIEIIDTHSQMGKTIFFSHELVWAKVAKSANDRDLSKSEETASSPSKDPALSSMDKSNRNNTLNKDLKVQSGFEKSANDRSVSDSVSLTRKEQDRTDQNIKEIDPLFPEVSYNPRRIFNSVEDRICHLCAALYWAQVWYISFLCFKTTLQGSA